MSWIILFIGIVIGWLTKIPFLLKWYRELKQTQDYKFMKLREGYKKHYGRYPEETL